MKILFAVIVFHLSVILLGRNSGKFGAREISALIVVTILLVGAVLYGMFTMRNPVQ